MSRLFGNKCRAERLRPWSHGKPHGAASPVVRFTLPPPPVLSRDGASAVTGALLGAISRLPKDRQPDQHQHRGRFRYPAAGKVSLGYLHQAIRTQRAFLESLAGDLSTAKPTFWVKTGGCPVKKGRSNGYYVR